MNKQKVAWPNKRKSIFKMEGVQSDSSTKCFIDHMGMPCFGPDYLSWQYKRAADLLVKAKQNGTDPYHPDGLFMPVGYLYRHALELKLKGLLESIIACDLIAKEESIEKLFSKHNIVKLWEAIKPILIDQWQDADRKPLANTEALLCEFHKIDKSGQSLRYSKEINGGDVRYKFPKILRLERLKEAFDEIYNLLDGCSMHFDNILESMNVMQNEYR